MSNIKQLVRQYIDEFGEQAPIKDFLLWLDDFWTGDQYGPIEMWCDASGRDGKFGWAVLGSSGQVISGCETGTHQLGELWAVKEALLWAEGEPAKIHIDSEYVYGVLTKHWLAKANRDIVNRIRMLISETGSELLLDLKDDPDKERIVHNEANMARR